MKNTKKILTMVGTIALTAAIAIGGTLAYLTASTKTVTNIFTVGNVKIDLTETVGQESKSAKDTAVENNNFKLIPSKEYTKDPKVVVEANSEKCWLFLKVDPNDNWDASITYTVNSAWTAVEGHDGYYYQVVDTKNADQNFGILTDNKITVKDTVTQTDVDAITGGTAAAPQIVFSAAAVQYENVTTLEAAWAQLPTAFAPAAPEAPAEGTGD